jgi:hypothetical protein
MIIIITMIDTISFGILDDLNFDHGPIHRNINKADINDIRKNIKDMISVFKWKDVVGCKPETGAFGKYCDEENHDHGKRDESGYFDEDFFKKEDELVNHIASNLQRESFYVINRYNKYYVIAFAINYSRFEIFSKDCNKILIDWGEKNGSIIYDGIIQDPDYNENPVIKTMRMINNS